MRVNNAVSSFLDVLSGVPQGSVLGPLLFLVYINDVATVVQPPVVLRLFADDCLIYAPVIGENDQEKINQCLEDLHTWCEKWDMEINYAKTTFAHITRKKNVLDFQYRMGSAILTNVSSFRYLGVVISNDLNWRSNVENVCYSSYKKLCFLRVKLRNATKDVKLMAYKTFIRPVLEYAAVVWSPHQKGLINELERIQRLAARFICSRYKKTDSVTEMLNSCKLELLETRRKRNRIKLLFQILQGQINIDKSRYIREPGRISRRINHSAAIRTYVTRTNVFRYSFFPNVIENWNALPAHIAECTDARAFEHLLDNYM